MPFFASFERFDGAVIESVAGESFKHARASLKTASDDQVAPH
jgi:hypothetical protein